VAVADALFGVLHIDLLLLLLSCLPLPTIQPSALATSLADSYDEVPIPCLTHCPALVSCDPDDAVAFHALSFLILPIPSLPLLIRAAWQP
jgi:hypothetical protein